MVPYHKIQSVFLRDPATNHKTFVHGAWSVPEFGYLADCPWVWTEKVDGTNMRVHWDRRDVRFGGRTDNAQIPAFLLARMQAVFTLNALMGTFPNSDGMTLYGEGFGARIQKDGGNYISDGVDFVLFDVMVGDIWLEREIVEDVATKLGIAVVPIVGRGTLLDAIDEAESGPNSTWGDFPMEGLVMRPEVELRTRRGDRIITKVKHKDFALAEAT